jgi:multimeric flavodoxin WrbA
MKALGIVGSPRLGGNTEWLTRHVLDTVAAEGLETAVITLADQDIRPCTACMACKHEERCPIQDELFPIYREMKAADAIILATPVYFGSATAQLKILMDRTGLIAKRNGEAFAGKVGGPLVVARRAGHNFTLAQLTFWYQILGFNMPGADYWNIAFGWEKGEVEQDREGLANARKFGKNLAFLVKKLRG